MERLVIVGGGKGGVGKSICAMGIIDMFRERKKDVLLVECDTSNPDVWKMYHKEIPAELIDLDEANGWIDLVNVAHAHPKHVVVVNTAARNNRGVAAYSATLSSTLPELERDLVTLWMINRQRDSLELLKEYMEALPESTTHVVRNSYFGEADKFELYNGSKIRAAVEEGGGKSLTFPELADRVTNELYSSRLSIATAIGKLQIGNRAELNRWRSSVHKVLGEAMDETVAA